MKCYTQCFLLFSFICLVPLLCHTLPTHLSQSVSDQTDRSLAVDPGSNLELSSNEVIVGLNREQSQQENAAEDSDKAREEPLESPDSNIENELPQSDQPYEEVPKRSEGPPSIYETLPRQQRCVENDVFEDCFLCGKVVADPRVYYGCCNNDTVAVMFCEQMLA